MQPSERVQMVHVVRCGIPGKARQLEAPFARFAQLLHADRSVAQDAAPRELHVPQQNVGRFRRAREGAREYLRMRDAHLPAAGSRLDGEADERLQARFVHRQIGRAGGARFGSIQTRAANRRELPADPGDVIGMLKDRSNRAVAGAEGAEGD